MILAKELRPGNLLLMNDRWVVVDVQVLRDIVSGSADAKKYGRIPLTQEVLARCGFRNGSIRVSNDVGWAFKLEIVKGEMVLAVQEYALPLGCKYLHQLQNIFYALTGEELTIST